MKLYYQTHSPYARKVLVLLHELGMENLTNVVHYETSPLEINDKVFARNPLGKVPILIDGDQELFDSQIISRYLIDTYSRENAFVRATQSDFQLEALATGMADAGILARWEIERRPETKRYKPFLEGQLIKITRAYDYLETMDMSEKNQNYLSLSEIAIATVLAWIEYVGIPFFSKSHPKLYRWYRQINQRPSMQRTEYSGTTHDVQTKSVGA